MTGIDTIEQQRIQSQTADSLDPPNLSLRGYSQTVPQVGLMVSPFDGELDRPAEQGQRFYALARKIRLDPTVRLVRQLIMAPLMRAGWQYESNDKAPLDAVELVKKQIEPKRLDLLRTSQAGMIDYGYAPYETWFDGAWNLRYKSLFVDYTTILVNAADGDFWGLKQQPQYSATGKSNVYLNRQECFIVAQDVEAQNYYGSATLRSLVEVYSENQAINLASRKYDAKVAGTHWVIYYPLGKSNFDGTEMDNGAIAKILLQKAESVGGIMVPRSIMQAVDTLSLQSANSEATQWKIELLSDKGAGQMAFENKLKYMDVLKVRAFGMPERAILEGQFGTKAEAETHADIAVSNLEVRHQMLVDVYNEELVNKILSVHFGPEAKGTVWIKPVPIDDLALSFNRQLYMQLLTDPSVKATELTHIDMGVLRDGLSIPEIEHNEESDSDADGWLAELGLEDNDLLTSLGLSKFDPNQPRDEKGQWTETVYHGTSTNFDEWKTGTKNAWSDALGFDTYFFAKDRAIASTYANQFKNGVVKEHKLDLRNPLVIDAKGGEWIDAISQAVDQIHTYRTPQEKAFLELRDAYYDRYAYESEYAPDTIPEQSTKELEEASRKQDQHIMANRELYANAKRQPHKYDGIIVHNILDMAAAEPDEASYNPFTTVYVAFKPSQIKKALSLAGFDPNQPRNDNNGRWTKTPEQRRDNISLQDSAIDRWRLGSGAEDFRNSKTIERHGWKLYQKPDGSVVAFPPNREARLHFDNIEQARSLINGYAMPDTEYNKKWGVDTAEKQKGIVEKFRANYAVGDYKGFAYQYRPDDNTLHENGKLVAVMPNGTPRNFRSQEELREYVDRYHFSTGRSVQRETHRGLNINANPDGSATIDWPNGETTSHDNISGARALIDLQKGYPREQIQAVAYGGQTIIPFGNRWQAGGNTYNTLGEAKESVDRFNRNVVDSQEYNGHIITRDEQGRYVSTSPRGYRETHTSMADLRRAVDLINAPSPVATIQQSEAEHERTQQILEVANTPTSTYRGRTITHIPENSQGHTIRIDGPNGEQSFHEDAENAIDHINANSPSTRSESSKHEQPYGTEKVRLNGKEIFVSRDDDVTTADLRKVNKNFTLARVVSLVGPQEGAEVTVYKPNQYDSAVIVEVNHPDYKAERRIEGDEIYNASFTKKSGSTAKNIGVQVVHDQAKAAIKLGYRKLKLYAAGEGSHTHELKKDGSYNGYYTWPRMGYDADLQKGYHDELQSHINKTGAKRVSDLMRNDLGRYLWQKHGRGMDMELDLSKGSLARKMLSAYYKSVMKNG